MENGLIYFSVISVFLFWIYKKVTQYDGFFEAQGIAHDKPLPIVGNILPIFTKKEGIIQFLERNYKKFYNEK
jgi:hypothetical protein